MSKNVILIENVDRYEQNLEEFVWQKSKGGKIALSKSDIEKLSPDERMRAIQLLEIYQRHPETFKEKKIEAEENIEDIPRATSKDLELIYNDLPTEKREEFLKGLFDSRVTASLTAEANGKAALPEDVKGILEMPQEKWSKLPKRGRELILEKFTQLEP